MVIYLRIGGIRYEVDSLTRMLLPNEPVRLVEDGAAIADESENHILIYAAPQGQGSTLCTVRLRMDGAVSEESRVCPEETHAMEQTVCTLLYGLFTRRLGRALPWGMLTGVRPVKLVRELAMQGTEPHKIAAHLQGDFHVSPERTALCMDTWAHQADLFCGQQNGEVSLYVAIPFCPSRCSYCSFVSHSIEKTARLVPEYVEALCREIRLTGSLAAAHGLRVVTVYMGGGTPTTLTAEQLRRVLETLRSSFSLAHCREITVEAGRPDTITREKLEALAACGVTRISINPQTLSDEVLQAIGRRHTVQQFYEAYRLAREFPFGINVDLIAGLPGEDMASFCGSIDGVLALRPENITVHTLTIKHASALHETAMQRRTAFDMVEYSRSAVTAQGYAPYYLYRQKGTVDSLENVGYSLDGARCLYNVYIMDDSHSIISMGAGGVTKLVAPGKGRIERCFNYKYPYEYISRFESVLERKRALSLRSII